MPNLTGKYVFDANPDIVELLRERGMLLGEQKFHHSYPYCWRSKTPIIFRNVEQFFIRIDALRGKALEAIHNEVNWIPSMGRESDRRHSRIAPRLGDLASAQLGRAVAGLL